MQGNFKYPRIKKIHQKIVKIARIDQKDQKAIVSCYHMNSCIQKFTTHQFTYFIYLFQDNFRNAKIPTCTTKDTCKTIFYYSLCIVSSARIFM